MKITLVGSFPLDSEHIHGGIEASVYGLAVALAEAQHQVVVADMPRIGIHDIIETHREITIHRFENKGEKNVDGRKRAADMCNWIEMQRPQICHLHGTGYVSYCLYKILRKKKIPTLLTIHGLIREEKRKSLAVRPSAKMLIQYLYQSQFEKKLIAKCNKMIVDTQYVADIIEHYNMCRRKELQTEIIPQGISKDYFQIACSKSSNEILSVGSFSPRKGHWYLIKAIEPLLEEHSTLILNIAGSMANAEYYNQIQQYITEHHLSTRIRLFPNADINTIHQLYSQAHIFCLHSFEESQGIVLAEAMSTGLPIVATNVGGIPWIVQDQINGLLSDPRDSKAFASNVMQLMQNAQLWNDISTTNRQTSVQYCWDNIAARIEKVYNDTILP